MIHKMNIGGEPKMIKNPLNYSESSRTHNLPISLVYKAIKCHLEGYFIKYQRLMTYRIL